MNASAPAPKTAGAPPGRVPDFFIVGHPKSGTSALWRMLRTHPQLHMPRKEPSFFVPELLVGSKRYPRGIEDYKALFSEASPGQLVGESTTWYLWSQTAAARIAAAQPEARIIAILREPASFLRSLHLQFMQSDVETEPDFRKAMALEGDRAQGRKVPPNSTRPQLLGYSEHVRYVEQLQRYRSVFPAERVLVLIYEDFRADNEGTVREVLRFLEVDERTPIETLEANPTVGVRAARLNELVRSLYLGRAPGARALKRTIKAVSSRRMRHAAMGSLRRWQFDRPAPEDPEFLAELRVRFTDEVQALSDYLDRDLVSFWGYGNRGA
jgi:Sulfotransferase domain